MSPPGRGRGRGGRGGRGAPPRSGGRGRGGGFAGGKRPPADLPAGVAPAAPPVKKARKNEDVIKTIVAKWETMRRHDTPADTKQQLAADVLAAVKGDVARYAASHTTSRVLQAAVKAAPAATRAAVLAELGDDLLTLAKSSYGHFLVRKLVATAPKEDVPALLARVRGRLGPLLRHPTAAAVVDELYARAAPAARDAMAAEFYSREAVLLPSSGPPPASLAAALEGADAAKRRATLARLAAALTPIVEKGMLDPVLVHRLLADYLAAAPLPATADLVTALCTPSLLRIVHTPSGAAAAAAALARATAKDRKHAVKAMKGHAATMARDEWGAAVLAAALAVVDDTALLGKIVVPELVAAVNETPSLATHTHGRRVLASLLAPDGPAVPPHVASLVKSSVATAYGDGGASKKEPAARRRELLGRGDESLGAALLKALTDDARAVLRSPAADVLVEAARGGSDGVLTAAHADGVASLLAAVVADAADGAGDDPALSNFHATRALKRLALAHAPAADALWASALAGKAATLVDGHAAKVVAAVVKGGSDGTRKAAAAELHRAVGGGDVVAWANGLLKRPE